MKKKYFFSLCYVAFCSILLLFTTNCSKESENQENKPTELNTEKSQYAPYEVVTISTTEKIISLQSTTANINSLEIPLDITDGKISFLLPNLNNGVYTLSFSSNKIKYEVPITVESLSNVLSADVYFAEMTVNIQTNINELNAQMNELEQSSYYSNEHIALKNDISKYTNLINSYTESYKKLTEEQKQEFAKMIAANKTVFDLQSAAINKLSTKTLKQAQSVSDYEENVKEKAKVFVESTFHTIDLIPKVVGLAILAQTPIHPFINAGAILAAGIYVAKFMISAATTVTAAVNLTAAAIKPSEFTSETNKIAALEFNSGIEKAVNIQVNYRSLIASDANDSAGTIRSVVESFNTFKEEYTGFIKHLPDLFKPSYSMSALKNNFTTTTRSVFNKYISITNISNPNVTIEQYNQQDGSIKIKATTTATTDQTFTYNVNYTNSNFTNSLTNTVNAKVIAKSCDLNTIIGTWSVEMYNTCYPNPDGTPSFYQTCTLILYQGGQSMLTYNDGTQAPGTYTYNADCTFSYNNLTWCGGATGYPPSSINYQNLYSCGCLSLKHIKQ